MNEPTSASTDTSNNSLAHQAYLLGRFVEPQSLFMSPPRHYVNAAKRMIERGYRISKPTPPEVIAAIEMMMHITANLDSEVSYYGGHTEEERDAAIIAIQSWIASLESP